MKNVIVLLLFATVFISGCTSSDPSAIARALPQVQEFLADHPDAQINAVLLSEEVIDRQINSIREDCEALPVKSYWKITFIEENQQVISYLDSESSSPVCVVRTVKEFCGDNICQDRESSQYNTYGTTCPHDCGKLNGESCNFNSECISGYCDGFVCNTFVKAYCGDGICDTSESSLYNAHGTGCPRDCGLRNGQSCNFDSECLSEFCDNDFICSNYEEPEIEEAYCGDGVCQASESSLYNRYGTTCTKDCGRENGDSCSYDSECLSGVCDDFICGNEESDEIICGDGVCHSSETYTCRDDCSKRDGESCDKDSECSSSFCSDGVCDTYSYCGDGVCQASESSLYNTYGTTCTVDCGVPDGSSCNYNSECLSGFCNNFICGEFVSHFCGDGVCQASESSLYNTYGSTCPSDCGLENGESCDFNSECLSGLCVDFVCSDSDPLLVDTYCGDGVCQASESSLYNTYGTTCTADCGKEEGASCNFDSECLSGVCFDFVCTIE